MCHKTSAIFMKFHEAKDCGILFVLLRSEKFWLWRQRTPVQTLGEGERSRKTTRRGVENALFWREIARYFRATGVFLGGKSHDHCRFCLAKRFSSTEMKFRTWEKISNNYKWKKSSTEYSVVFLGNQKVQVTLKDFIFVVGSVLRTGSAQRLSSQYFAAVLKCRAGAFWFFLSITMVFATVRTHFPRTNTRVYRN